MQDLTKMIKDTFCDFESDMIGCLPFLFFILDYATAIMKL